ncbi:50S ribosomal protein L17 [Candidatus Dependentiae bacterium]|nr:50S ribosomal protein L17 [Candidatus Dependentiae bacterium]
MKHQIGKKKLNRKPAHKKAMLRNQIIHFIEYGCLQTTKPRTKEVQRLVEKLVTVARNGYDFNTIRKIKKVLPYKKSVVEKLIKEIAPKYANRSGGYTRVIPLGKRSSDTSVISRLEWV